MEDFNLDFWEQNREKCSQLLSQEDFMNKIPYLDDVDLSKYENKLVRFRGMVQDTLNPVYYFEKCQVFNSKTQTYSIRSGKYRDFIPCGEDEELMMNSLDNIHQEKHIVYCVKVPGLNSWTHHFKYTDDQDSVNVRNEKRKLQDAISGEETMEVDSTENADSSKKIAIENASIEEERTESRTPNCDESMATDSNTEKLSSSTTRATPTKSCLLNFYDDLDKMGVKVNDVIEVVGFLGTNQIQCDSSEEELVPSRSEPRIHVIHTNSNVSSFSNMLQYHKEHVLQNAQQLRDELWLMLTDILAGDTLAADYLICHLISSVYSRQDMLALGKFSLNISNVPFNLYNSEYVNELYKFISHLIEKSHFMPVSIPYLNDTVMIPKKDNDQNRLISGLLQMSSNTHLVIDETRLEAGRLVDRGVRNVQALSDVITNQKLDYDFEFYRIPFHTDIPVLTFSEGKSLLPSDCLLVMEPDKSCMDNIAEAFSRTWKKMCDPLLSKLRVYLNTISSMNYELCLSMQQTIQEDFVKMRQEDSKVNADDLHLLLVLSRLISVSRGINTLQKNAWDYACQIEKQRKERLR